MNTFTLAHTVISLLPVGFGFAAFVRHGAIEPGTRLGKWYIGTMLAGTISGFGFIFKFGFTPGQVLGLFTLGLLMLGMFTLQGHWRKSGYVQTFALSTSYFMLMVFATTETLKHFPLAHPYAAGANDPSLIPIRLSLLVLFVTGVTYQVLKIRAANRVEARLERLLAKYHAV